MNKKNIVCGGLDLALNHFAYVELTNGDLSDFFYMTSKAGAANRSKKYGTRLILPKTEDRQLKSIARIAFIKKIITEKFLNRRPDFSGIEDYAVRAEHGAHQLGEVNGIARMICWDLGIPFRLHDPISVKMFATHDGTASKDEVERMVMERWGVDFSEYNQPPPKPTAKNPEPNQDRTVSEDLCDAFAIAKLVWTEVQLREGKILLSDLHKKEIQVFNRTTKSYPVSLLGREWLCKPQSETPIKDAAEAIDKIVEKVRKLLSKGG